MRPVALLPVFFIFKSPLKIGLPLKLGLFAYRLVSLLNWLLSLSNVDEVKLKPSNLTWLLCY